jgi:hypothetical protein
MKRCPECEFLYEDDQRLCDMDGIALVHDSHVFFDSPLQAHHAAGHVWQRFAIAFPLMVLAVVGFHVLKQQPPLIAPQHQAPAIELAPTQLSSGAAPGSARPAANAGAPASSSDVESSGTTETNHADGSTGSESESKRKTTEDPNSILTAPESTTEPKATPSDSAAAPTRSPGKSARPQNTSAKKVSAAGDQEKDSKVASFFKKTGRILKKPFKL